MNPKSSSKRKDPSTWCPKCAWYKGLNQPLCPHCGFNEETGGVEAIREEKQVSKREAATRAGLKISPSLIVIILVLGLGAAYAVLQIVQEPDAGPSVLTNDFQDKAPLVSSTPELQDRLDKPILTTTQPTDTSTPIINDPAVEDKPIETLPPIEEPDETTEPPSETLSIDFEKLIGKWTISYGNLSTFSKLHFIGDGEFKADGTYKITSHPKEFKPNEGIIEFTGRYSLDGTELVGTGRSSITQNGQPFGVTATDKISGELDLSMNRLEGVIESVSSFHAGGSEETAVFEFILERE
jgi:hypothetical protein